jgi:hypothetical protein
MNFSTTTTSLSFFHCHSRTLFRINGFWNLTSVDDCMIISGVGVGLVRVGCWLGCQLGVCM